MNRRKFFKRLGMTAAVAAIAPQLLAEESAPTYTPMLCLELEGRSFTGAHGTTFSQPPITLYYPYLKAWKKPVDVGGVKVMFLPRQLSWAKDMLMINSKEYQSVLLEVPKRTDIKVRLLRSKVWEAQMRDIVDDLGYTVKDIDTNPEIPFGIIPE